MHLSQKIVNEVNHILQTEFNINMNYSDWVNFFSTPLFTHNDEINEQLLTNRQTQSLSIIQKILTHHGKQDIVKFLGELAIIEPKIQELQPWVRDHIVHSINTFLVGVYILYKIKLPAQEINSYHYSFMWKLCGPTHDLGYPIEISHNVKREYISKINTILNILGTTSPKIEPDLYPVNLEILCNGVNANDIIQKRLTEWNLDIDVQHYYSWLSSENKADHGVISALSQLKIIDAMYHKVNPNKEYKDITRDNLNYNQRNFDFDIVSASSALFIHNISLNYTGFSKKINFKLSPLAFLLFLCDTFQEWDRYSVNREIYNGMDFDIKCKKDEISLYVPMALENKMITTLKQRLSGFIVNVNDKDAVS